MSTANMKGKGGFEHGQQNSGYNQSNQYGGGQVQQYGQGQGYDQQASQQQGGPWGQGAPPSGDPSNPYGYDRTPADPNNPQEGERGFMGAVAGGVGGAFLGNKAGHGIIGALAGAFLGSKAEDKFKERRHNGGQGGW